MEITKYGINNFTIWASEKIGDFASYILRWIHPKSHPIYKHHHHIRKHLRLAKSHLTFITMQIQQKNFFLN